MRKLLPLVMLLIGAAAGLAAGVVFRPIPASNGQAEKTEEAEMEVDANKALEHFEYVKLNNQFVVPVVNEGKVTALVVMALSVEVPEGHKEWVFKHEPKLRDSFLQVLFDHANIGGFEGAFTDGSNLAVLRNSLKEIGQSVLGQDQVTDVLITEIARQDY